MVGVCKANKKHEIFDFETVVDQLSMIRLDSRAGKLLYSRVLQENSKKSDRKYFFTEITSKNQNSQMTPWKFNIRIFWRRNYLLQKNRSRNQHLARYSRFSFCFRENSLVLQPGSFWAPGDNEKFVYGGQKVRNFKILIYLTNAYHP